MASIYSLMGSTSSSSSIYGSRGSNIISGLASGLDTESMIEGMLQSYKQKIQGLQQDRTKLQWQQSAYQSISNKLVELSPQIHLLYLHHQPLQQLVFRQCGYHHRQGNLRQSGVSHR